MERGELPSIPLRAYVSGISAGIVDNTPMLDLCYEEDSHAMVDMNCVMTAEGRIIELQATGEGRPYTREEQQKLLELCEKGNRELCALLRRYITL